MSTAALAVPGRNRSSTAMLMCRFLRLAATAPATASLITYRYALFALRGVIRFPQGIGQQ